MWSRPGPVELFCNVEPRRVRRAAGRPGCPTGVGCCASEPSRGWSARCPAGRASPGLSEHADKLRLVAAADGSDQGGGATVADAADRRAVKLLASCWPCRNNVSWASTSQRRGNLASWGLRDLRATPTAPSTKSMRMCPATRQLTILLKHTLAILARRAAFQNFRLP